MVFLIGEIQYKYGKLIQFLRKYYLNKLEKMTQLYIAYKKKYHLYECGRVLQHSPDWKPIRA